LRCQNRKGTPRLPPPAICPPHKCGFQSLPPSTSRVAFPNPRRSACFVTWWWLSSCSLFHVICSEVDADLAFENEGIVNSFGAAGIDHVLDVRLKKHGTFAKIRAISPFQDQFVILRADRRIKQLLALLGVTQVAAKIAVRDTEAG